MPWRSWDQMLGQSHSLWQPNHVGSFCCTPQRWKRKKPWSESVSIFTTSSKITDCSKGLGLLGQESTPRCTPLVLLRLCWPSANHFLRTSTVKDVRAENSKKPQHTPIFELLRFCLSLLRSCGCSCQLSFQYLPGISGGCVGMGGENVEKRNLGAKDADALLGQIKCLEKAIPGS